MLVPFNVYPRSKTHNDNIFIKSIAMYTLGMWLKFYLGLKYLRLKSPLKPAKLSDTLHNSSLKHPDNRNYVTQKKKSSNYDVLVLQILN